MGKKGGSLLIYLGWIVAAFLGGFLLAYSQLKKRHALRDNFARVEMYQGRTYREILTMVGAKPNSVVHQANGLTLRTWQEPGYAITLLFDRHDVCLGVEDESFLN